MKHKFPSRFYVMPGLALINCPLCGKRPFFESRLVARMRVICPVTKEYYVLPQHTQFSVSCHCNIYPYFWGPDLWNTAKGFRTRLSRVLGRGMDGQFLREVYEGTPSAPYPCLSQETITTEYGYHIFCLSPDDTGCQPLPEILGLKGVYYPVAHGMREGPHEDRERFSK